MTGFALHRIVINEDRADHVGAPFQLQVSVDEGETWYAVMAKSAITISGGKQERMTATVPIPLYEFEDGRFGALVEGKHISYDASMP